MGWQLSTHQVNLPILRKYPLHYCHHNETQVDWCILFISTFDSLKKRKGLPPFQIKHALGHPLLWGGDVRASGDVVLSGRQPPKRVNPAWLASCCWAPVQRGHLSWDCFRVGWQRRLDLAQAWWGEGQSADGGFILRCAAWLSRGKARLEARPTCTDIGVARTGGWTFHHIAPAWGAAVTLMAGGRPLSLLRGGGGGMRRPTSLAALSDGGGIGRPHDKDKVVVKSNECCDISITMLGEEAVCPDGRIVPAVFRVSYFYFNSLFYAYYNKPNLLELLEGSTRLPSKRAH
jgi:hypothetical protein